MVSYIRFDAHKKSNVRIYIYTYITQKKSIIGLLEWIMIQAIGKQQD